MRLFTYIDAVRTRRFGISTDRKSAWVRMKRKYGITRMCLACLFFTPGVRLIYMLTHFVRVNVGLDNVCKINFRVCRQDLGFTEFSLARIQEYRK